MAGGQESAKRAKGQAPTPFGEESNDRKMGGVILGPMVVEPSPIGNLGAEPVGGPKGGGSAPDPLGLVGKRKKIGGK